MCATPKFCAIVLSNSSEAKETKRSQTALTTAGHTNSEIETHSGAGD
jgi:hypothetical protein